jgi:3-methyladenine DNA glycosylase/8-oxoguanine DNA glycosylase
MSEIPRIERRVPPPPGYHLGRSLSDQRMGRFDPTYRLSDRRLLLARWTPEGPATLQADRADRDVAIRLWGDGARWLDERVEPLLGFEDDPSSFRPDDPIMRRMVRQHAGMHLPRLPAVTDRLAQIVMMQLVASRDAFAAWGRLVGKSGEPAPGPHDLRLPPTPPALVRTPVHDLIACGVAPRQARVMRLVARESRRFEWAASEGRDALTRMLRATPGIGVWSTSYLLGSALGEPDAVLCGDYNLPHTLGWMLQREPRGSDARMLELLEPFRGHRYRVIRLALVGGVHAPRRGPRLALRGAPSMPRT